MFAVMVASNSQVTPNLLLEEVTMWAQWDVPLHRRRIPFHHCVLVESRGDICHRESA